MVELLSLPRELLEMIVAELNVFDIESLAQTYNHTLYTLCQPLFDLPWTRKARHLISEYGNETEPAQDAAPPSLAVVAFPGHLPPVDFLRNYDFKKSRRHRGTRLFEVRQAFVCCLGADPRYTWAPTCPLDLRWMNLNGSFDWLVDPDPVVRKKCSVTECQKPAAFRQFCMEDSKRDLQEHGLRMPDGFEKFMLSEELCRRIPFPRQLSSPQWAVNLRLRAYGSSDNAELQAYLLPFLTRNSLVVSLLLRKDGSHGVVCYDHEWKAIGNLKVVAFSFEEFLAMIYFEEYLDRIATNVRDENYDAPSHVKEYFHRSYRRATDDELELWRSRNG